MLVVKGAQVRFEVSSKRLQCAPGGSDEAVELSQLQKRVDEAEATSASKDGGQV